MIVSFENSLEKRTEHNQDHPVCLHLFTIFTDQGHINELFLISHTPKWSGDIFFKIIPLKTEFFWHHKLIDNTVLTVLPSKWWLWYSLREQTLRIGDHIKAHGDQEYGVHFAVHEEYCWRKKCAWQWEKKWKGLEKSSNWLATATVIIIFMIFKDHVDDNVDQSCKNWKHCGRVLLGNWASPRGRRDHHTTPPPPILIVTVTIWRKKKEKTNTETTRIRKTTTRKNDHILAFQPMRSVCKIKPALDYFSSFLRFCSTISCLVFFSIFL